MGFWQEIVGLYNGHLKFSFVSLYPFRNTVFQYKGMSSALVYSSLADVNAYTPFLVQQKRQLCLVFIRLPGEVDRPRPILVYDDSVMI